MMTRAELQTARLTLRPVAPKDEGAVGVEDRALCYWLTPQRHGFGYATEAACAVVLAEYFAQDPADIASGYYEGNTQSAKVLCKRGFAETGRRPKLGFRVVAETLDHSIARGVQTAGYDLQLLRADWSGA